MKKLILVFLIGLTGYQLQAQDVHFSQFAASPLTLNPALTGLTPCTYRAALNYRNQYASIVGPSSYQTYSGAFDIGFFRDAWHESMLGLGVMVINDISGDGGLKNFDIAGSLAYHQCFDGKGNHYLSAGIQAAWVQKSIQWQKLIFESQIGANGVDPLLPSGEYGGDNFSYLDLNAGVNWRSRFSDKFAMQLGGAYYHITEPAESFYSNTGNKLNARYVGYGNLKIAMGKKGVLIPSGLYMQQTEGSNEEIVAGASFGMQLEKGISRLYLGAHYRNDDAIIASFGLDYNNINFGLSYDVNISDLKVASNSKGGIELSLVYYGCININPKESPIDCPRFY